MTEETRKKLRAIRRRREAAERAIAETSAELTELVPQAKREGAGPSEIARDAGVSRQAVYDYLAGRY